MQRTEADAIAIVPIRVILGGKEHDVKPLNIKQSQEWRKKAIEMIAPLPAMAESMTPETIIEDTDQFKDILNKSFVGMPEQTLELFFMYAKDLDRDEIENTATDAEMAVAFQVIGDYAFPLSESLPKLMGRLSQ